MLGYPTRPASDRPFPWRCPVCNAKASGWGNAAYHCDGKWTNPRPRALELEHPVPHPIVQTLLHAEVC